LPLREGRHTAGDGKPAGSERLRANVPHWISGFAHQVGECGGIPRRCCYTPLMKMIWKAGRRKAAVAGVAVSGIGWDWLVDGVKLRDRQNRWIVVTLAAAGCPGE